MYIGTAAVPEIMLIPFASQSPTLPIPHGEFAVPLGIANGPVSKANDCRISDMLSPKIIRRYGVDSPRGALFIMTAIAEEAMNDMDADDI